MDNILNWGIGFIVWLQSLGSWLTPIMKFFTSLGNENFYLFVAPTVLWCIDATLGLRIGLFLMVNTMVNNVFKVALHGVRPYWFSTKVKVFGVSDVSFGVPSAHAQNGVVLWGTIAERIKRSSTWVIAIIIIFFIGISRMYLAVHFPHDILVGWLLGVVLLFAFIWLEKPVVKWIKQYSMGAQILFSFIFSMLFISLFFLARLSLSAWTIPADWENNVRLAFPDGPTINPLSFYNLMANPGAFFGMAAGWIWLTAMGGFTTKDVWWKLVLRYLVGVVGIFILFFGLGSIFPDSETLLAYALRYIRYALIGFWSAGLAPWLFVRLKLASRLTYIPKEEKTGQQATANLS